MKTEFREGSSVLLVVFEEDLSFLNGREESVLSVRDIDWNRNLSPWPSQKIFHKGSDFGGNADQTLTQLLEELSCHSFEKAVICGYSLAGLFALYACTKTDRFAGCVCASGSLWYPGFAEYLRCHPVHCETVYLSLGESEKNSKNRILASVQEKTEEVYEILKASVPVKLEMNPGGHFSQPDQRLRKGIDSIVKGIR